MSFGIFHPFPAILSIKFLAVLNCQVPTCLNPLPSRKQIRFLEGRGFKHVGTWQFNTAKNLIDRIAGNGWKIPNDIVPQEYKGA